MKSRHPAPHLDANLRAATALIALPAASHLTAYLFAARPHLSDQEWPAHARFHALQGLLQSSGWDICVLAAALGPLQRRKNWALWFFLGHALAVQAGYFASAAMIPAGRPSRTDNILYAISAAMSAAGLAESWRQLHNGHDAASERGRP